MWYRFGTICQLDIGHFIIFTSNLSSSESFAARSLPIESNFWLVISELHVCFRNIIAGITFLHSCQHREMVGHGLGRFHFNRLLLRPRDKLTHSAAPFATWSTTDGTALSDCFPTGFDVLLDLAELFSFNCRSFAQNAAEAAEEDPCHEPTGAKHVYQ